MHDGQPLAETPTDALAAVFSAAGTPLELKRFALPSPAEGEILVRTTLCTICGSDLHTYEGLRSTPTPTVLGHEIVGMVAGLGPEAGADLRGEPLAVGDRITWSVAASCGSCFYCEHGTPQKCDTLFKYGHESTDNGSPFSGGMAEYCLLRQGAAVVKLPDALEDQVACPANCATATVAAALRIGGFAGDETILIQGAGMLGLTACAMARTRGARHVIVCDVDARRVETASRFGATHGVTLGASHAKELAKTTREVTDGRGVDVAVELSGADGACEAALEQLRIGGRYVLVGAVFPGQQLSVSSEVVIRRLLAIHGIHNYTPDDLVSAVEFLARHGTTFPFATLVERTFPLTETQTAIEWAAQARPPRVGIRTGGASPRLP